MGKLVLALVTAGDRRRPPPMSAFPRPPNGRIVRQFGPFSSRAPTSTRGRPTAPPRLHWAVHWQDTELARLLIRARADVNATNAYGVMPLSLAAANGDAATAAALLEAGANPNVAAAIRRNAADDGSANRKPRDASRAPRPRRRRECPRASSSRPR